MLTNWLPPAVVLKPLSEGREAFGMLLMVCSLPETSVPLIMTPGATVRLWKLPTGADSNVIVETGPNVAAAVSNVAAAASEFGRGELGPAPRSVPMIVT